MLLQVLQCPSVIWPLNVIRVIVAWQHYHLSLLLVSVWGLVSLEDNAPSGPSGVLEIWTLPGVVCFSLLEVCRIGKYYSWHLSSWWSQGVMWWPRVHGVVVVVMGGTVGLMYGICNPFWHAYKENRETSHSPLLPTGPCRLNLNEWCHGICHHNLCI